MARKSSTSRKPRTNKKKAHQDVVTTKKGKRVKELSIEIPAADATDNNDENLEPPRTRRSTRRGAKTAQKVSYAEYGDSVTEDDDSEDMEDNNNDNEDPEHDHQETLSPKPVTTTKRSTPKTKKFPKVIKKSTKKSPSPLASTTPMIHPSPSIREITKNMWTPNKGDWRVSGAIDYA